MRGIHAYQTRLDSSLPWIRTAVSGLRQGSPNQSVNVTCNNNAECHVECEASSSCKVACGGSTDCNVTYDQAGNANYNAAPQLTEAVNSTKAAVFSQTIASLPPFSVTSRWLSIRSITRCGEPGSSAMIVTVALS